MTPAEFKAFLADNRELIQSAEKDIVENKRCTDCAVKVNDGFVEGSLIFMRALGVIRDGKQLKQCEACHEIFSRWVMKEIDAEKVSELYAERFVATIKKEIK
jgi:hypothetical protein